MNTFKYEASFKVYLNGKHIGSIHEEYAHNGYSPFNGKPGSITGYRYFPNGDKMGGDLFPTFAACRQSIEAE